MPRRARTISHVEPLLLNGQLHVQQHDSAAAELAKSPVSDLVLPTRRRWGNLLFLLIFTALTLGICGGAVWSLVHYFDSIWQSGFVAALHNRARAAHPRHTARGAHARTARCDADGAGTSVCPGRHAVGVPGLNCAAHTLGRRATAN